MLVHIYFHLMRKLMVQKLINIFNQVKSYSLFIVVLLSCNSDNKETKSEENQQPVFTRNYISDVKSNKLFEQLAVEPQRFQINLEKDTIIVGEGGVQISIPENSFVDKNGNVVTQDITLEIIEASSIEDYIRNDLQTISNGKLLQSAGMIYIDAKSNGESIFIDGNSPLNVKMPTSVYAEGYKIFEGDHDTNGNINWEESETIDDLLTPIPMSEFDYKYYTKYTFPTKMSYIKYLDSAELSSVKYENTFIATEEFERRFRSMGVDAYYWWEEYETGYGVDRIYGEEYLIQCPLLEVYLQNLDKPLWYSDSIAYDIFRNKEIKDSTERNLGWEEDVVIWYGAEFYKKYYDQRLTNVKIFDPRGVDVSQPNAMKKLMETGENG